MSGIELVTRLNARAFMRPIILITGHGDIDMAVAAIKLGASISLKSRSMRIACLPALKRRSNKRGGRRARRHKPKRCKRASMRCHSVSAR
jgi:two-component system, LuxR family, response regulator FixJ